MIYKFEHLNSGLEIEPTEINVVFAGFYNRDGGKMVLEIELKTETAKFVVELSKVGTTTDRSDEAIHKLMVELLEPYKLDK